MELPKRKRNRLTEYDYSTANAYFITICTVNRKNLFWKDVGAAIGRPEDIPLTTLGAIVRQRIADIPKHYPMICVDHFVIMPNHIHLLLQIKADHNGRPMAAPTAAGDRLCGRPMAAPTAAGDCLCGRPMAAPTISTVINQTKGAVSKQIGFSVWQKGFHDHVVRGERDYMEIWNYIEGNPYRWAEDELCTLGKSGECAESLPGNKLCSDVPSNTDD